jgi:enoyl-CoA hydratase/carnithine racemase
MSRPATAPSAHSTSILLREDREGIAVLTLNRPEARNSLSEAMLAALDAELTSIRADKSVRAVILAAKGPAFSAGHDLKETRAHRNDPDRGLAYFIRTFEFSAGIMQSIVTLPQPVIAAIEAVAAAAGCQLVASCDLIVASEAASFSTPGINIGLFCSSPMVALSRKVASNHAMEMLLTGEPITAARAHEIGLVNRVVAPGRALDEALAVARVIASKSSHVQKIGKEAYYRQLEMSLVDAYAYASRVMAENMLARDAEEGIAAFIEKRMPKWEDR